MRLRHKVLVVGTSTCIAFGLTACGGGSDNNSSQDSAGGSDAKVTLTYLSWDSDKAVHPLVDAFEQENPNIKIDVQPGGSPDQYAKTLTTRIGANQIPDIFHMSTELRNGVMKRGAAKDITNEPFMKGINQVSKDMYSLDGKVYGMSVSAWGGVIVYNKALLKKANAGENVPETLPEFIKFGEKIKAAGITPYMEETSVVSGSFLPMLGGVLAKEGYTDATNPVWTGKETFTQSWLPVIKQWAQLSETGVMPKTVVGLSGDQVKQQFIQGKLAMYRSGPWDFPDLHKANIDFGVAPYPAVEGGEAFIGGGPDSPFCLSSTLSGNKLKAAEKFMTFVNSPKGLQIASEKLGKVISSSNYDGKVDPAFEDVYKNYLQKGKFFWSNWPKKANLMGSEVMPKNFQALIRGEETPEQVAKALDEAWAN